MNFLRSFLAGLCLFSVALPAVSAPPPFSGATITQIILKDDLGKPYGKPDQLTALLGLKPGDGFSGSAVRDGIRMLYLKGTFKDIRVEAFPEKGGVRLEYTLVPVTTVRKVLVHGNRALPANSILAVFENVEGKELREEKLPGFKADISDLYQAAGYYHTEVAFRTEPGAKPNAVELHVDIREGSPTRIQEITFVGYTVFKEKKLRSIIKSKVGAPLDRDLLLDADMEALLKFYAEEGYPAAKPGPVTMHFQDHKAHVRILGSEGPRVTVRFSGNREFSPKKLSKTLLIWSEQDVSDTVIDSSLDKIRTLYRQRGYADAAVEVKKTVEPGGLVLDFSLNEGPRVAVRRITIRGNTAFPTEQIKREMALREPGWFKSRPFRSDLLDKDLDNLIDRYLEAGYQAARADKTVTRSADKRFADVVIELTEGPRTMTGRVSFEGNRVLSPEELLDMVGLKPGSPYNERILDEDKYRILSAYTNKGYLYAAIDADKTATNGTVDVTFRIVEDEPVRIGRIILRGNERTKDHAILRELLVKPGDAYDYGAILASQQRIYRLGYFRLARFEPVRSGEKEYAKDMLLTVEERPAGAMEVGVGYGDLDRLRGFVELSHRNLFGTAQYSSLRYEQSDILKRAVFNYQEPWFLNRRLESKFSLVWSDAERLNSDTREIYYKTRKTAAAFGVEKAYDHVKPSLTYQFENVVNYDVKVAAQLTPEDSGRVLVSSLSPALIWDLRDDVFNPRKGSLYGVILKAALRELASEADFSKLTVQASRFQPIGPAIAAFSARAGTAWPYRGTAEVPLHERFYVGGSTTVRGFNQDAIGPAAPDPGGALIPQGGASMAVFNIELRFNPGEGLGFVLFSDAGNVWSGQEMNLGNLRASYGAGVRYGTPIGPFRLDYGQKVERFPGESPGELHFNIGNTF